MPQFIRTLASLWTLLVMLVIAVAAPARSRYRPRPPLQETGPSTVSHRAWTRSHTEPPTLAPAPPSIHGTPLPDPTWLDPTDTDPVRPYVTEFERHRQGHEEGRRCPACGMAIAPSTAPESPSPPVYGDGLDDVRAELSPLVRAWLSQREENRAGVVR